MKTNNESQTHTSSKAPMDKLIAALEDDPVFANKEHPTSKKNADNTSIDTIAITEISLEAALKRADAEMKEEKTMKSNDTETDDDSVTLFDDITAVSALTSAAAPQWQDTTALDEDLIPPAETPADGSSVSDEPQKKPRDKRLLIGIPVGCVMLLFLMYMIFVFAPIPFIRNLRDLFIGTAMTTADHQWMVTAFMPDYIIEEVMRPINTPSDIKGGTEHLQSGTVDIDTTTEITEPVTENELVETEPVTEEVTEPVTEELPPEEEDILGLKSLKVGDTDYAGYEIVTVDEEEGLFISKITGTGYQGLAMVIDDPARIFVGSTPEKGVRGYRIPEMIDYYGDVIAGINASGFEDSNDSGTGGKIIGYCMSEGETWGTYIDDYPSIVLTKDNKLAVGSIGKWSNYNNIRDGMQFGPVLIADGEKNVEGAIIYGLHPRAAIGQREDGAIILLVIDGRDVANGIIGCTVYDMADIMEDYGAVNAGCCDGGSSVVMAYDGEVINKNSSANPTYGRRLPNAFLVRSKKAMEEDESGRRR